MIKMKLFFSLDSIFRSVLIKITEVTNTAELNKDEGPFKIVGTQQQGRSRTADAEHDVLFPVSHTGDSLVDVFTSEG